MFLQPRKATMSQELGTRLWTDQSLTKWEMLSEMQLTVKLARYRDAVRDAVGCSVGKVVGEAV
jgi:hypothetical protein